MRLALIGQAVKCEKLKILTKNITNSFTQDKKHSAKPDFTKIFPRITESRKCAWSFLHRALKGGVKRLRERAARNEFRQAVFKNELGAT
ncbi:hypothetical protein TDB9533_02502 [Thalassocella blandensis]|nr:hypothetical protein TDB9533_02502 [Thalassocella blandensis]